MTTITLTYEQIPFPSEQAAVDATKLTVGNIQFIRNRISSAMEELLTLQLIEGESLQYAQRVATIRGQIQAYSDLINSHNYSYIQEPSTENTHGNS